MGHHTVYQILKLAHPPVDLAENDEIAKQVVSGALRFKLLKEPNDLCDILADILGCGSCYTFPVPDELQLEDDRRPPKAEPFVWKAVTMPHRPEEAQATRIENRDVRFYS